MSRFQNRAADRKQTNEEARNPTRNQQPDDAPACRENQAFQKKLPDQTCPAGSQCRSNRDFPCPAKGSSQKKLRRIRARNEQQNRNASQQQPEQRTLTAHDGFTPLEHPEGKVPRLARSALFRKI